MQDIICRQVNAIDMKVAHRRGGLQCIMLGAESNPKVLNHTRPYFNTSNSMAARCTTCQRSHHIA